MVCSQRRVSSWVSLPPPAHMPASSSPAWRDSLPVRCRWQPENTSPSAPKRTPSKPTLRANPGNSKQTVPVSSKN